MIKILIFHGWSDQKTSETKIADQAGGPSSLHQD